MAIRLSEINVSRSAVGKRPGLNSDENELREMYYDLSLCLDNIRDALIHLEDVAERVCLAVLEDDVSDLLDECGEMLVVGEGTVGGTVESLESRSSTVIEELKSFLDFESKQMAN